MDWVTIFFSKFEWYYNQKILPILTERADAHLSYINIHQNLVENNN